MAQENNVEILGKLVQRNFEIGTGKEIEELFSKVTIGNNVIFEIPYERQREFIDFVETTQGELSQKILQAKHEITLRLENLFGQYWNKWSPSLVAVHMPAEFPIHAVVEMVEYSRSLEGTPAVPLTPMLPREDGFYVDPLADDNIVSGN
jgi:hypothetical protein